MIRLFLRMGLVALLLVLARGNARADLLINKPIWDGLNEYVIDKAFANFWWNVDLFCRVQSGIPCYVGFINTNGHLYLDNTILVFVDPCFNRLVYIGDEKQAIRSYGSAGSGSEMFMGPMAVDMLAPINYQHDYSNYYNIFVADRDNDRVERLRYRWTTPDSGMIHVAYYTNSNLVRPVDLDVDNAGTFYPDNDDYVWVASDSNAISAINTATGTVAVTYGSSGSGVGQFNGIEGIACGKSFYSDYANTDTLYVADTGNRRIVMLTWNGTTVGWVKSLVHPHGHLFKDLEVDNFGNLWVLGDMEEMGIVFKFTDRLEELGISYASDSLTGSLFHPVCISNTGGYLGGNGVMITERWAAETGIRAYAIGTDVKDLFGNTYFESGVCRCSTFFTLADFCDVQIGIYDGQGRLVRSGSTRTLRSGLHRVYWDGRNYSGDVVAPGYYRIQVTATALYRNRTTGLPTNTVVKDVWVTLCQGSCSWLIGEANGDGTIDVSDAVYLSQYIFVPGSPPPTPHPVGSGDADCSHAVDVADAVYLITYVFIPGSPPPGNPDNLPPDDCTCSDYR